MFLCCAALKLSRHIPLRLREHVIAYGSLVAQRSAAHPVNVQAVASRVFIIISHHIITS
ncbi:uncharacterized protein BDR25DRAFT_308194, partial [Lindgomyces ingoldianus]